VGQFLAVLLGGCFGCGLIYLTQKNLCITMKASIGLFLVNLFRTGYYHYDPQQLSRSIALLPCCNSDCHQQFISLGTTA